MSSWLGSPEDRDRLSLSELQDGPARQTLGRTSRAVGDAVSVLKSRRRLWPLRMNRLRSLWLAGWLAEINAAPFRACAQAVASRGAARRVAADLRWLPRSLHELAAPIRRAIKGGGRARCTGSTRCLPFWRRSSYRSCGCLLQFFVFFCLFWGASRCGHLCSQLRMQLCGHMSCEALLWLSSLLCQARCSFLTSRGDVERGAPGSILRTTMGVPRGA